MLCAFFFFRWTGANTLLSTRPRPTRTTTPKGRRTTWATPTAKGVKCRALSTLSTPPLQPRHPLAKRCNCVCRRADSGFFYNIIRVPPLDSHSAKKDAADLTGAEVICSIPAEEPRKPSYYHSFGKTLCSRGGTPKFYA